MPAARAIAVPKIPAHDPFDRAGRAAVRSVSEIRIESGIPLPTKRPRRRSAWFDLAQRMQIGDSVVIAERQRDALRHAMRGLGQTAKQTTLGDGTLRVWRIK